MSTISLRKSHLLIPIALAALALGACGKKPADEQAAAQTDAAAEAQAKQDADIKQREEELNRREQELAMKEKEKLLTCLRTDSISFRGIRADTTQVTAFT